MRIDRDIGEILLYSSVLVRKSKISVFRFDTISIHMPERIDITILKPFRSQKTS